MKARTKNTTRPSDKSPFDKALIRLGQHLLPQQPLNELRAKKA